MSYSLLTKFTVLCILRYMSHYIRYTCMLSSLPSAKLDRLSQQRIDCPDDISSLSDQDAARYFAINHPVFCSLEIPECHDKYRHRWRADQSALPIPEPAPAHHPIEASCPRSVCPAL